MVSLRDPVGTCDAVLSLSQYRIRSISPRGKAIRAVVQRFLEEIPVRNLPSGVEAMRLLEKLAMEGVRFPAALIMLSKVVFTLDGILHDVSGADGRIGLTIARQVAQHWLRDRTAFRSPLKTRDWITVQCSTLLLPGRLWVRGEQAVLDHVFAGRTKASPREG